MNIYICGLGLPCKCSQINKTLSINIKWGILLSDYVHIYLLIHTHPYINIYLHLHISISIKTSFLSPSLRLWHNFCLGHILLFFLFLPWVNVSWWWKEYFRDSGHEKIFYFLFSVISIQSQANESSADYSIIYKSNHNAYYSFNTPTQARVINPVP